MDIFWMSTPMPTSAGMARMGRMHRGPAIKPMSATKTTRKGTSMQASSVDEEKNSRSWSNSRRLLVSAPVDSGLASRRMESTLLTRALEMTTSALRPATSTK